MKNLLRLLESLPITEPNKSNIFISYYSYEGNRISRMKNIGRSIDELSTIEPYLNETTLSNSEPNININLMIFL